MSGRVFFLFCVVVFISSCYGAEQKYDSKFDNINLDEILGNKRVLSNYVKCIMDEGPCTPEGREFRSKYVKGMFLAAE